MAHGVMRQRSLRLRILAKKGARGKCKRDVFANAEKIAYLKSYKDSGMKARKFEREKGLPQHAIGKWLAKMELLQEADPAGFSAKQGAHHAIEWGLKKWVWGRIRRPGLTIPPGMLALQAKKIALQGGIHGFKASRSWCTKFRRRHGLVCVTLRGERASANHDAAREYPAIFRQLCQELNISVENIYNFDETLLYPRIGTRKTVCPVELAREIRGCTQRKTRLGMLITTCADGGQDIPVLFANTSGSPYCLKGKNYTDIQTSVKRSADSGHYYFQSHNGWVSRDMVVFYLTMILPQYISNKSPGPTDALVLMDGSSMHSTALFDIFFANYKGGDTGAPNAAVIINCTGFVPQVRSTYVAAPSRPIAMEPIMGRIRAHGVALIVGNVRLHVRTLPPKTTSELQPCDQGLISWVKHQWRLEVDRRLLVATSEQESSQISMGITVQDAMEFTASRLRSIPKTTGTRYWRALLVPDSPTYADILLDRVGEAEGLLVAEEKATYD
jgi:hypothetical protein